VFFSTLNIESIDNEFPDATFSGLLQFPTSLATLSMTAAPGVTELNNTMTIALPPVTGSATSADINITCCPNAVATITYQGSPYVNNAWTFAPSFLLTFNNGVPLIGLVTISYPNGDNTISCQSTTNAAGVVSCAFPNQLGNISSVTVTAEFGDMCQYAAVSIQVTLTVFGFGDNSGTHAFVVTDNTNLTPGANIIFAGISLLNLMNSKGSTINKIKNLTGGFYANVIYGASKCMGTWNWTQNVLNQLPQYLPTNLGILVASNTITATSGGWNKILILNNINYHLTPFVNSNGTVLGSYFASPPL